MSIPLFFIEKVDSTMNEIKKDKYRHYNNVAIISRKQTDGRGRRKKKWISEIGNIYLSIRLKRRILKNHHLTSYMVGIVVYESIKKFISNDTRISIKWPNDILINNKKVAGILIEFISSGNNITDVIIGIGVNIKNNPLIYKNTTTCLSKYSNINLKVFDLVSFILDEQHFWMKILNFNNKLLIKEWMKRSKQINADIKFYHDNKLQNGKYQGICPDGSIKVLVNNKINSYFNLELV